MENPKMAIIVGAMKKKADGKGDNENDDMGDGLDAAAEEAMSAVKSDDPKAFAEALKSFVQMCMDEY